MNSSPQQAAEAPHPCGICGNSSGNRVHEAREMMFGLRDRFRYLECGRCGCVALMDIPPDMGRYYPPDYYSLQKHGRVAEYLRRRWAAYAYGRFCVFGWAFSKFCFPNEAVRSVRRLNPAPDWRILDVGCGSGNLLRDLQYLGFKNLAGVDPFIARDLHYPGGLTIYKRELGEMKGEYDLIMLHHSFEHMNAPLKVIQTLKSMLRPRGTIILRIPVASSLAWKSCGVNWFNMDPPRHFFLHTGESIQMLAEQSGLCVRRVIQEDDGGIFVVSEAYRKDIPANDPRFPLSTNLKKILSYFKMGEYRRKGRELSRAGQSDLVCFELGHRGD